jgi:peptide/nickel transport system substrate-binding protein
MRRASRLARRSSASRSSRDEDDTKEKDAMTNGSLRAPRRLATALGVGLAAALAISGCSATVQTPGSSASSATGSLLVAADNGSPTFVRNFNPYSPSKRNTATIIYEPLFVTNSLDGKAVPFLGTAFTQPDAKSIVVDIRQGVTWSDGQAFSAADVVFTYDLLKKFPALDTTGVWQHLAGVEANGSKVTMTLTAEDVPAAAIVLGIPIVSEHLWKDVADPVTATDEKPVGTGPYTLGDFGPNQYKLEKNATYWQADKVAATELVIPASNTQLDVVNNGYDWAYAFMSDVENTWVKAGKGNTYWFPPGGTISLLPNLTKAPFNDVNFRKGLSAALDRKSIADVAEEGYVQPASQSGLLLPNQKDWLNADLPDGGAITQDAAAAAELFAKAGYTKSGDKLVDASGQPLTLAITTANGWTDWLRGVQEVQKQLQAVGITVTINQPQPAAYQQAIQNGDFDLAMGSFGGTGSVYQDFNNLLSSEFLKPVGTSTTANFQRFSDPAVDALLAQLKVTIDPTKQKAIANQLQQAMYDQVPVISMFYGGLWGLFSDKSYTNWPSKDNAYATPATWGSNPLLVLTNIKKAGS